MARALALALIPAPASAAGSTPTAVARDAIALACVGSPPGADTMARRLELSTVTESNLSWRDRPTGWRRVYALPEGGTLALERREVNGSLHSVVAEISDARHRPMWLLGSGSDCVARNARRLVYDDAGRAVEIENLDADLEPTGDTEPLNPPVPAGTDPGGQRVALVDAGVDYRIPQLAKQLARNAGGEIIGYDFWDLDSRPFDAHQPGSPFFVQRHGTRTASVLINEAPGVALVPYRYPRSDMARMEALVDHAARHQVAIVGLPLGGNRAQEWSAFAKAARAHPEMLFIASAGNDGRDIDRTPVYPAALDLPNLITVTSADDDGAPAERANWGASTVELLVPAEELPAIDFGGRSALVSGSSYAVARVAALAARLRSRYPGWDAEQIKTAIFASAVAGGHTQYARVGFLPDPLADQQRTRVRGPLPIAIASTAPASHELALNVALLSDSGWNPKRAAAVVAASAAPLAACGIQLRVGGLYVLSVPPELLDFRAATAKTLVDQAGLAPPSVYLVRDTKRQPAFDGEAFGRANTARLPWLRDTVWLTANAQHPGIALAHELLHVLTDSGEHVAAAGNLMNERTDPAATQLTAEQCEVARRTGTRNGLLTAVP